MKLGVRTVEEVLERFVLTPAQKKVLAWANSTQKEVLEQVGQQRANVGSSTLASRLVAACASCVRKPLLCAEPIAVGSILGFPRWFPL